MSMLERPAVESGKHVRAGSEITNGVRLVAITTAAAVLTATLVIGVGGTMLPRPEAPAPAPTPEASFTRASLP